MTAFVEISILFRGHQRHWSLSLANNSANLTPKLSPTFHVHLRQRYFGPRRCQVLPRRMESQEMWQRANWILGMFTVAVKTCVHPLDRLCSELKLLMSELLERELRMSTGIKLWRWITLKCLSSTCCQTINRELLYSSLVLRRPKEIPGELPGTFVYHRQLSSVVVDCRYLLWIL